MCDILISPLSRTISQTSQEYICKHSSDVQTFGSQLYEGKLSEDVTGGQRLL